MEAWASPTGCSSECLIPEIHQQEPLCSFFFIYSFNRKLIKIIVYFWGEVAIAAKSKLVFISFDLSIFIFYINIFSLDLTVSCKSIAEGLEGYFGGKSCILIYTKRSNSSKDGEKKKTFVKVLLVSNNCFGEHKILGLDRTIPKTFNRFSLNQWLVL